MQATGLIAVWLHVPPHREEEFHAWYELEHIPQVVGLEGFVSGRRYYCEQAFPKFLALYETQDESVEDSPGFQHVVTHPTPWSGRIWTFFGKDRIRQNLVRLACVSHGCHADPGAVLLRAFRTSRPLAEADGQEQGRASADMPGCTRYRLFRQVRDPDQYLEIFDFTAPAQATGPALEACFARPARRRFDDGAQEIARHAYTATGTPLVKAAFRGEGSPG
ncbi:DUF4286 family protein [Pigmentiphaga sp.]|uniref:DUF4286 family protein n=1 Tax=Pigmentiphaga sp. TaxID=1977564 RepID=UPI00128C3E1F|nr:DUF4286 family protein [Pigmentiphaga sp.]MPS26039.1 hypothetical protein [Alcaligenaceae bacterium SAGV5]MPS53082.1 hypothetical protein [Alcaligenaceae bacterium SAGV3]MPT57641.1 hypothetical protein [Alcaligenaceae bacterium]